MKGKTLLSLIFSLGFYSCELYSSNYDFETNAIYTAPKSRTTAYVLAKGFVPKGADLGEEKDAHIEAKIVFEKHSSDTVYIVSSGSNISSLIMEPNHHLPFDSSSYADAIFSAARNNSVSGIDSVEIGELADVILATGFGPKGTHLKGQTKAIIVDTVFYTTKNR